MDNVKPEADRIRERIIFIERGLPLTLIAEEQGVKRQAISDWIKNHGYLEYWRRENWFAGYSVYGVSCEKQIYGRLSKLLSKYVKKMYEEG